MGDRRGHISHRETRGIGADGGTIPPLRPTQPQSRGFYSEDIVAGNVWKHNGPPHASGALTLFDDAKTTKGEGVVPLSRFVS